MPKCPTCQQELPEKNLDNFEQFWQAYPKKFGKVAAMKAWKRLGWKDRKSALVDLGWNVVFVQATGKLEAFDLSDGRYEGVTKDTIPQPPYPATYLNGRRWEDELPTQTIPDLPKKAEPDGGLARRPAKYAYANGEPPSTLSPLEARGRLAEILKNVKVKSL